MPNVTVRDLPADVHRTLTERAASTGQSLQQYLVAALTQLAQRPTMAEVLARIEAHEGGSVGLEAAVEVLREERRR